MDLAVLCDMYVDVQMAPMDAIWLFSVLAYPLPATCGYMSAFHPVGVLVVLATPVNQFMATHPPPTLLPYSNASGIGYGIKKLSKMAGNSASYPLNSC